MNLIVRYQEQNKLCHIKTSLCTATKSFVDEQLGFQCQDDASIDKLLMY